MIIFFTFLVSTFTEQDHSELIKLGMPIHNSNVERFNRTYRTEVLNMYAFKQFSRSQRINGQLD